MMQPAIHPSARPPQRGAETRVPFWRRRFFWLTGAFLLASAGVITSVTAARQSIALPFDSHKAFGVTAPSARMDNRSFTKLPVDWLDRGIDMRTYFAKWCLRPDTPDCPDTKEAASITMSQPAFFEEFFAYRTARLSKLDKASFSKRHLVGANFDNAAAEGVSFREADLTDATFTSARLENLDLTHARLSGADFTKADLRGATLQPQVMENDKAVIFADAALGSATLHNQKPNPSFEAHFNGTDLTNAELIGLISGSFSSTLTQTHGFRLAKLHAASLQDTLITSNRDPNVFRGAQLAQASGWFNPETSSTLIQSVMDPIIVLSSGKVELGGAGLIGVDFSEVALPTNVPRLDRSIFQQVFRNSFGDGTVVLPAGISRPCHWLPTGKNRTINGVLSGKLSVAQNSDFFGAWRAWRERGGKSWPPFQSHPQSGAPFPAINLADYKPRPDLLPPEEICTWTKCDCDAVAAWRASN